MHMQHVRLDGAKDMLESAAKGVRPISIREGRALPVVDDLNHREAVVDAPGHFTMRAGGVVLGAQHPYMMATTAQLTAELERVDLSARRVPWQEIVNNVKKPQPLQRVLSYASGRETALGGVCVQYTF